MCVCAPLEEIVTVARLLCVSPDDQKPVPMFLPSPPKAPFNVIECVCAPPFSIAWLWDGNSPMAIYFHR
nr:MAG TPA: hypothetical protein [Caudoviricetes sp.]